MAHLLDIVGDVHGELPALEALGRKLGYRVANGWGHPKGRTLVFLGDLVERGAHSLEVSRLVMSLVSRRRAFCIMGNHEYNLVAWYAGWMAPKESNRETVRQRHGSRSCTFSEAGRSPWSCPICGSSTPAGTGRA
jgi:hypothetical protein